MFARTKRRQLGSSIVVIRYHGGICTTTCHACRAYHERYGWRRALREARAHACPAPIPAARYGLTPAGLDAITATRSARGGR
jgi:hypothetical protein